MTRWIDSLRGLVNQMTGLGGAGDKGGAGVWVHTAMLDRQQIEAAYRTNWMIRKAVDIPVFDQMRQGWRWQGDSKTISKIETAEHDLKIAQTVYDAMVLGRLYGGGAIIMSDGRPASEPLESVGRNGLKFMTAVSRYELTSADIDRDPMSPGFLEPVMYRLNSAQSGSIDVHPSRVVRFLGARLPRTAETLQADQWSDSVVEAINQAIQDATGAQQGIAHLVQEASVDIWRIHGFMQNVSDEKYRKAMLDRMALVAQMKSMVNATAMDAEDEYNQKTANFSQLPDILMKLLQVVSGAVDIPATRFLGQSPAGMNATGESDMRNYYDRLKSEQELFLRPSIQKIMDVLVASVLGSWPEDLWFEFPSLWQTGEKERAEIGKLNAESVDIVMRNALVPSEVMAKAVTNQMIESGNWPGLEAAWREWEEANPEGFDVGQREETEPNQADPTQQADAAPRTLYIRRDVLNADEIGQWARSQGFATVQEGLHVTVIHTRTPMDWIRVGAADEWEADGGKMEIAAGGPRLMERFGDAVVLQFASSRLTWRHEDIKRKGAQTDFPEYQPHITISWNAADIDLAKVEPYKGRILLGPEIFEEVNDDWKAEVKEA